MFTNKSRFHWDFPMTPVDQNCKINLRWTTVVEESIQSRPDSTASKDDIINQDNMRAIDGEIDRTTLKRRITAKMLVIVTIERNVQNSEPSLRTTFDKLCKDSFRHLVTATPDSYKVDGLAIGR
jgi:hypothetical protein